MTKIMLVGEAWGEKEEQRGKPFVGPAGRMLSAFLAAVGIDKRSCYITNTFNFRPAGNNIDTLCGPRTQGIPGMPAIKTGKYVRAEFGGELQRLYTECKNVNPNLIIPLGAVACWALLHSHQIKKLRGTPVETVTGHKALPTYHPSAVLRDMKLRPIVFSDLQKAVKEAEFPDIRRPVRQFQVAPTLADLAAWDEAIMQANPLSVDIETWNLQITCIGFAPSPTIAFNVPFIYHGQRDGNYWRTKEEELTAWNWVRRWCEGPAPKIGQNILYDMRYLWQRYGIRLNNVVGDTMLIHHAMQPEMEKSLGFLGSLYTNEPSWKFMRKDIKTLKKED